MSEMEVICGIDSRVGRITLNRPQALHALTTDMCRLMIDALIAWRDDPAVELVMLDHAGSRGFCAGGDIRMLAESGAGDGRLAREFFFTEYRLNHLLFDYPKPTLVVMDGITMGGGVGLSLPCRYRVATQRTIFAMPETGIGLFPDVGGGWYLPRMPGRMGLWLALTGARVAAADCEYLGIATDVVDTDEVARLKRAVLRAPQAVDALLHVFRRDPGPRAAAFRQAEVDDFFGRSSLNAIVEGLVAARTTWAAEQLAILATKSPQALHVAFRQLELGAEAQSFAEQMALEYRIAAHVLQDPDFLEGVRAVIIEKDGAPAWRDAGVKDVTEQRLDRIFSPLPQDREWSPVGGLS